MTTGIPVPPPRNFPFTWQDPADADRYWVTDLLHNAYPRPPLLDGLMDALTRGMERAFAIDGPPRPPGRTLTLNGYVYREVRPLNRDATLRPPPIREWSPEINLGEHWEECIRPRVLAITEPLKAASPEGIPALAAFLPDLVAGIEGLGTLHHQVVLPNGWNVGVLARFLAANGVNEDVDVLLAGMPSLSLESTRQQWALGRMAAANPELCRIVTETPVSELELALRSAGDAGTVLLAGVAEHLAAFGWRPVGLHPFTAAVVDDSSPVWETIRMAADGEMNDPDDGHGRAASLREQAAARVRAALPAELHAEFERHYATALPRIRITEDHNVLIDQVVFALMHRTSSRLSAALHDAGLLPGRHDGYFLTLDEALKLDGMPLPDALVEAVEGRRADWERWCTYTPPAALGVRPESVDAVSDQFLGRVHEQAADPRVLTGTPSARGIATGRARVLRDMAEADRLRGGDVLVCITTLPAWTPLFARAAAVVTASGGTLCHAAITAREFGIPAVLSVLDCTTRIRDGQLITVDGNAGIVRLED